VLVLCHTTVGHREHQPDGILPLPPPVLPAGVKPIHCENPCCCTIEGCRQRRVCHEFGSTVHLMPDEYGLFAIYCRHLGVEKDPGTVRTGEWHQKFRKHKDRTVPMRYAHIHHYKIDRRLTESGRAALNRTTAFADDKREGRPFGSPPLPSRPISGQFGIEASPSKHGDPATAAVHASASKRARAVEQQHQKRARTESAVAAAAQEAATVAASAAAQEQRKLAAGGERAQRRKDLDFANPADRRGIDPNGYMAGAGLGPILTFDLSSKSTDTDEEPF
jgi:hypothetical protein